MKATLPALGLILAVTCSLRADQLDDLFKKVRAGQEVSITKAESQVLLEPAVARFAPAVGALYLAQVKASLVDPANHMGWPCRSFWLWTEPHGPEHIHKWLTEQFASEGDALYLYADICPLIFLGRNEEVAPLLDKLSAKDKFLAERATANLDYWREYIRRNKSGE